MRLLSTTLFLLLAGLVLAPYSASALTLTPTKFEVAADPGGTVITEIVILNEQQEAKTFYLSSENFEPRGETGSPFFVGGGTGLASWITTQESVFITAGERVSIPVTINIPPNTEPGGYFAAVFFGSQPPAAGEGSGVSIGGKVGTLILLRVNGEVKEEGGLLEFTAGDKQRLFGQLPISFVYRLNNAGGDRVVPRGEIKVTNTFGQEVIALSANENEGSVLPGSIRRFETKWSGEGELAADASFFKKAGYQFSNFHFGLYKASLDLTWGTAGQKANNSYTIIIFPWQLIVIVLVSLVVIIFAFKQYNRIIIARSKGRG